jgi:hypothetical protein
LRGQKLTGKSRKFSEKGIWGVRDGSIDLSSRRATGWFYWRGVQAIIINKEQAKREK